MTQNEDKNNIFDDNFGESTFSTKELFDTLQWSVLQQEIITEIIPILTKDSAISSESIDESLKKISSVSDESIAIYALDQNHSVFTLNGSFTKKGSDKSIFQKSLQYTPDLQIIRNLRKTRAVYLKKRDNFNEIENFLVKYFPVENDNWWIFPLLIKDNLYGIMIIFNPNLNTVNNILFSFYKSVALVFAQAYDRVAAIAESKSMLDKVAKANKLKTAFLTNISHEVRTPVNSIVGFSDLLADPDLTIDQREEFITMITKSSQMLVKMFDNIIDASKLQSNQISFRKEWFDIKEILKEIEIELREDEGKTINDKVFINVAYPDDNQKVKMYTDIFRVRQVMGQLIENALEHTEEGEIEIGVKLEDDQIQLYVKDSGKGIDKDKQSEIFSLFESEEHAFTFESGGSGLGLSISKEMIEQLGGRIWFDSVVNHGTTFFIAFPEKNFRIEKIEATTSEKKATDWAEKTILIAEDVEFNYIFLREIIAPTGAKVIWAKNGLEACQIVDENNSIDLILMDLQMPEMNGYEAATYIKKKLPQLPIIAQTAFMMANEDEKCYKIGCDGFISKPIRARQLISTIKKFF
jgi:signal transduction histidine kinase